MSRFAHALEEEVTVDYPPTPRYPRGRSRDGVIARCLRLPNGRKIYVVLFDDDQADTRVPESWISPRRQEALPI